MRSADRDQLARLQRRVSAGNLAMVARNRLLMRLFDEGVTQQAMADVINVEQAKAGLPDITNDAVHRAIKRLRDRTTV